MKRLIFFFADDTYQIAKFFRNRFNKSSNWIITLCAVNPHPSNIEKHELADDVIFLTLEDGEKIRLLVVENDMVISLLEINLTMQIALYCLHFDKHLITNSAISTGLNNIIFLKKKNTIIIDNLSWHGLQIISGKHLIDKVERLGGKVLRYELFTGEWNNENSITELVEEIFSDVENYVVKDGILSCVRNDMRIANNSVDIKAYWRKADRNNTSRYNDYTFNYYVSDGTIETVLQLGLFDVTHCSKNKIIDYNISMFWRQLIKYKFLNDSFIYNINNTPLYVFLRLHLYLNGFKETYLYKALVSRMNADRYYFKSSSLLFQGDYKEPEHFNFSKFISDNDILRNWKIEYMKFPGVVMESRIPDDTTDIKAALMRMKNDETDKFFQFLKKIEPKNYFPIKSGNFTSKEIMQTFLKRQAKKNAYKQGKKDVYFVSFLDFFSQ